MNLVAYELTGWPHGSSHDVGSLAATPSDETGFEVA